ncbi:MAG: hypothetical protein IT331_25000 [Anaerolineae bacterium]|nr:hypothetical protein [Anaerolineae bacterium]
MAATQEELQAITSRAIFDNAYRIRLLASPKKAAEELNIKLSRKEIKYVKSLDPEEIHKLAARVQDLTHTIPTAVHWG